MHETEAGKVGLLNASMNLDLIRWELWKTFEQERNVIRWVL